MSWEGDKLNGLNIKQLPSSKCSNHGCAKQFSNTVISMLADMDYDAVVGFNKMAGLDVYYAADTCYQANVAENKSSLYKLTARYKTYLELERTVFSSHAATEILLLSPQEMHKFIDCYKTPKARFHLLPPGITSACFRGAESDKIRQEVRQLNNLRDDEKLLLMVGSAYHTKGVDRTIRAMASLPPDLLCRIRLMVIGKGDENKMARFAENQGVGGKVEILGGRDDVPRHLMAADLLVHPARVENTGTILAEALAAGLPVLTTANCGYAFHVENAVAGQVVPMPFDQRTLNLTLQQMLENPSLKQLGRNGNAYATSVDMVSLHEKAVDIIESVATGKNDD